MPSVERYYLKKINNNNYFTIKKIITDLEINFIDIHKEVFANEKKPIELFSQKTYHHYTVDGYNKISKKIFELTK